MKIVALFAALLLAGCTSAVRPQRDDVVLVRAKLVSTIYRGDSTVEAPQAKNGEIAIHAESVAERFEVLNVLAGHTDQSEIANTEYVTGQLKLGVVYFVIETRRGGVPTVEWSAPDFDGLCMDEALQRKFAIADEVAALQKDYPCTARRHSG